MNSKLSVDCILRLIDLLTYDDEKLLFDKLIKERLHFYKIRFDTRAYKIKFNTHARSEQEALEKILPEFESKKLKPYIRYSYQGDNSFYCHICMKIIYNQRTYLHSHNEIEYEPEYINWYINENIDIYVQDSNGK